jgi:hypothetical protein
VDREHIAYLVEAGRSISLSAVQGDCLRWNAEGYGQPYRQSAELRCTDSKEAVRVGRMLWRENINSVSERYQEPDPTELPGVIGEDYDFGPEDVRGYHWTQIKPVEVLAACACYAYQSCEHEGWKASEARAYIEALKNRAIRALPGYGDAPWGAPKPYSRPAGRAAV